MDLQEVRRGFMHRIKLGVERYAFVNLKMKIRVP
jgi:hypothetical protein